ncbi:conserved hypothetical protein [Alkaliphilus metalliredigens QYMF]|uniref:DUF3189 domain-containing protein n=1 Tax=Alkaliphilus metalliredigens (strain QYMF) TaxID=293826 RepID=A6TS41_ALKMQ|nr:DUF3189 family protein [Alkaliphilus metalliredigens]ABR49009.1 conserved hypothetical protein [Alkaliphilus metalliredigens QYMF]
MKIIYNCYGGTHTSIVTASIHVGRLPMDRIPHSVELNEISAYDRMETGDIGYLTYMGKDEYHNDVYAVGLGSQRVFYTGILHQLSNELTTYQKQELLVIDTLRFAHFTVHIGGFLSRKIHLISLGRPLVNYGIKRCYPSLIQLVANVKKSLQ